MLELLFFVAPAGLIVFLLAATAALALFERYQDKKTNTKLKKVSNDIVHKVVESIKKTPQEWSIRWGIDGKIKEAIKYMAASQKDRENEVVLRPNGSLFYQRGRREQAGTTNQAYLPIKLKKSDKAELKRSFDTLIAAKMTGAIDNVVM